MSVKHNCFKKEAFKLYSNLTPLKEQEKKNLNFSGCRDLIKNRAGYSKRYFNKIAGLIYRKIKDKNYTIFELHLNKLVNNKKKKELLLKVLKDTKVEDILKEN